MKLGFQPPGFTATAEHACQNLDNETSCAHGNKMLLFEGSTCHASTAKYSHRSTSTKTWPGRMKRFRGAKAMIISTCVYPLQRLAPSYFPAPRLAPPRCQPYLHGEGRRRCITRATARRGEMMEDCGGKKRRGRKRCG